MVIGKEISRENLDDVYKQTEAVVKVSNKSKKTSVVTKATKVKELEEFNLTVKWAEDTDAATKVNATLLNVDGESILEDIALDSAVGTEDFVIENGAFKEAVELIEGEHFNNDDFSDPDYTDSATAVKPRLATGTYFLVVDDAVNAIKAYEVKVTEGGVVDVVAEVEAAKTVTTSTTVDHYLDRSLLTDANEEFVAGTNDYITGALQVLGEDLTTRGDALTAVYGAYQTVAGKQVLVRSTSDINTNDGALTVGAGPIVGTADLTLTRLAASQTYAVKTTGDYVVGAKEFTIKPDKANNNLPVVLEGAGKVTTIALNDKDGNPITDRSVYVNSLKVTNEDGTVAELKNFNAYINGGNLLSGDVWLATNFDQAGEAEKTYYDAREVAYKAAYLAEVAAEGGDVTDAAVITDAEAYAATKAEADLASVIKLQEKTAESLEDFVEAYLTNIKPGEYAIELDIAGYEPVTEDEAGVVLDFHDAKLAVNLTAIEKPVVTGYVRLDGITSVAVYDAAAKAEASIIAYDENGKVATAIDFGEVTDVADENHVYTLNGLEEGKTYKFVVRGKGFETKEITKTITAGTNKVDFDVVKGGNGKFKLSVVDTNNNVLTAPLTLTGATTSFVVTDGNYVANDTELSGIEFTGLSYLAQESTTGTSARTFVSAADLSAGSYKLAISEGKANVNAIEKYLDKTVSLVMTKGGTVYATSTGEEIIQVPLKDNTTTGSLDVFINLTVVGDAAEGNLDDIDFIQVLDKDGNIVTTKRADVAFTANDVIGLEVPNNATYTVKAYLHNGYVAETVVTVQRDDQKATINVDQATR